MKERSARREEMEKKGEVYSLIWKLCQNIDSTFYTVLINTVQYSDCSHNET